ncbi:Chlorophyll synthesis pathway, bchC [Luminiphilus syltensis NOR5-1B]|uniref:Chlorophyll synthesis pathway, bchC n=1 Tax=Luminiphilus syltensis NOR5-1B TaxID=565045 RepID=B8KT21_9GAMM|nr:chlorophyll synthesis pathway protein BchC [Luminiphilus syltensis]EED35918.1 Chlorophyll synthesis pathway, bchC [Luminiphilus syltensis NOR5-1B]
MNMSSTAVVFEQPHKLSLRTVALPEPDDNDLLIDVEWTGISTGTERLLWDGRMPAFPGLDYPLVPGYETIGTVVETGSDTSIAPGTRVFVPGSKGFVDARGLFGGAASRVLVAEHKAVPLPDDETPDGALFALTATAIHILTLLGQDRTPDLIVGHGALGRLLARCTRALRGRAPQVWETNAIRAEGATGYNVIHPDQDERFDYQTVVDVSGDSTLLDTLITRVGAGGTIALGGFYTHPLAFNFVPAFIREVEIKVCAEWNEQDVALTTRLIAEGRLSLDGLITHRHAVNDAASAYDTAFTNPECLKMVLDWREQ